MFCKKPLPHYKHLHEVFIGSVATGKQAFFSTIENNEDDDLTDVNAVVVVINSNSVAVVEVRLTRPLPSLSGHKG